MKKKRLYVRTRVRQCLRGLYTDHTDPKEPLTQPPKKKNCRQKKKHTHYPAAKKQKKKSLFAGSRATASRSDRVHQHQITMLHASNHPPMHAAKKKKQTHKTHTNLYKIYTKFIQFFFLYKFYFWITHAYYAHYTHISTIKHPLHIHTHTNTCIYTQKTQIHTKFIQHTKNTICKNTKMYKKKVENFSKYNFFQKLLSTSVWTYM